MDYFEAFKAITINPAKMLGLEDRIGSVEVGKDADFLITSGDPIQDFARKVIERVFINGEEYTAWTESRKMQLKLSNDQTLYQLYFQEK